MKYRVKTTKRYRKDYKRMVSAGKDIQKLIEITDMLASGKSLDIRHKDHGLKGSLYGKRECHIESDWLLLYQKKDKELQLLLLSTGDHRHVLGIE